MVSCGYCSVDELCSVIDLDGSIFDYNSTTNCGIRERGCCVHIYKAEYRMCNRSRQSCDT